MIRLKTIYKLLPVIIAGFLLVLTEQVSGQKTYKIKKGTDTVTGGFFTDDDLGQGGKYGTQKSYNYTMLPPLGKRIKLTFTQFDLECYNDFMYIYNGPDSTAPTIKYSTCLNSPGIIIPTNPTGAISFYFESDGILEHSGWSAKIEVLDTCETIVVDQVTATPPIVTVKENGKDQKYVTACLGTPLKLNATGKCTSNPAITDFTYLWKFSDGDTISRQSVDKTINTSGGMVATVEVIGAPLTLQEGCKNYDDIALKIKVPEIPNFTIKEPTTNTLICKDKAFTLDASADVVPWTSPEQYFNYEATHISCKNGISSIPLATTGFSPGEVITSESQIKNVCVTIEANNTEHKQLLLRCPNGQFVDLKGSLNSIFDDNGTSIDLHIPLSANGSGYASHFLLGQPVFAYWSNPANIDTTTPGIGYKYCFNDDPANRTIQEDIEFGYTTENYQGGKIYHIRDAYYAPYTDSKGVVHEFDQGIVIPNGQYRSRQSFKGLIGCPIGGKWEIVTVTEMSGGSSYDDANVFEWNIEFDIANLISTWSYTPVVTKGEWTGPGITPPQTNPAIIIPTTLGPATYTYTATVDNSCDFPQTVDVNVEDCDFTLQSDKITYCVGEQVILTATSGCTDYVWESTPAGFPLPANNASTGTFIPTVTASTPITYKVSANKNGSPVQPAEVTITVNPAPETQVPDNTPVCSGNHALVKIELTKGAAPWSFTYDDGGAPTTVNVIKQADTTLTLSPTATTTYNIKNITDATFVGCTGVDQTTTVTVQTPPTAYFTSATLDACAGSYRTIPIEATGTAPFTITYNTNADNTVKTITPNQNHYELLQGPFDIATSPYIIILLSIEDAACVGNIVAEASVGVIVKNKPDPNIVIDSIQYGCAPIRAKFINKLNGPNDTYLWDFGDPLSGNSNFGTGAQPEAHIYNYPGVYNVKLSITSGNDAGSCTDTATLYEAVTVKASPTADFTYIPDKVGTVIENQFQFYDKSDEAVQWSWNFNDKSSSDNYSNLQNPDHEFIEKGNYPVTLTITSDSTDLKCADTIMKEIFITDDFTLYVPNAFSPDGDKINDVFAAKGSGIDLDNYVMYVYDRWGGIIFSTANIEKGWDGTVNGGSVIAPIGVYTYHIILKDFKGIEHTYRGSVFLVSRPEE